MLHSITIPTAFTGSNPSPLPLYKSTVSYSPKDHHRSLTSVIRRYVRSIANDPKTRKVFFFLLLNLSFTGVEFLYGWWTNSLGLTADAVHMLFDSTAILFSLWASVVAKWESNEKYTYGYGRVETMTGFVNALALLFASWNIIWEACERFFDPTEIKTDQLLVVSVLGLLVNLVGIFAFDHGHAHGHDHGHGHSHGHSHSHGGHSHSHDYVQMHSVNGHDHKHHDHSHDHHDHHDHHHGHGHSHAHHDHGHSHGHSHGATSNPLMHGMFLHILSDTLGSVGVIISSLLIQWYGWMWADPLCSLFIAVLTIASLWPLLRSSGTVLLQAVPEGLQAELVNVYRKIMQIEGVVSYSQPHFWELSQDNNVGTIKLQVRRDVDDEAVRLRVLEVFNEAGVRNMVVQIERTAGVPDVAGYQ